MKQLKAWTKNRNKNRRYQHRQQHRKQHRQQDRHFCFPALLLLLSLCLLLKATTLAALFAEIPRHARRAGTAGLHPAAFQDGEALLYNPAIPAPEGSFTVSAAYCQLYSISELDRSSLFLLYRPGNWQFGLAASLMRIRDYQEQMWSLSLAGELLPGLSAGTALRFYKLNVLDIFEAAAWSMDFGLNFRLGETISLRSALIHAFSPQLGTEAVNTVAARLSIELEAEALPGWHISAGLSRDSEHSAWWSAASAWQALPWLELRTGFRSAPLLYTAGLGIAFSRYTVNYALRWPANGLDISHFLSISYTGGQKAERRFRSFPRDENAAKGDRDPRETKVALSRKINLNGASRSVLESLPGFSRQKAYRVAHYRTFKRPFFHIRDIARIRGITWSHYRRLKASISVSSNGDVFYPLPTDSVLAINSANFREWYAAGFSLCTVRKILLIRRKQGGFSSLQALLNLVPLSPAEKKQLQEFFHVKQ